MVFGGIKVAPFPYLMWEVVFTVALRSFFWWWYRLSPSLFFCTRWDVVCRIAFLK
jgi:hypothetical protein